MESIPASSTDIASIRLLGDKHALTKDFDENDEIKYLERYFTSIDPSDELIEKEKKVKVWSHDNIRMTIKDRADLLFINKKRAIGHKNNE